MSWEDTFENWTKPASDTEEEKMQHTMDMIVKALNADDEVSAMDITVLAQGSYRSNTNVRLDSDVDVCVRLNSTTKLETSELLKDIAFTGYRNKIITALMSYFGTGNVSVGNKAIDIHENSNRVNADVVPTFVYKRTDANSDKYGVTFLPATGGNWIINWPEQNYSNGVKKNNDTARVYKKVVRIIKRLRNEMESDGIIVPETVPSYFLECLVWNTPNRIFELSTYYEIIKEFHIYVYNSLVEPTKSEEWGEINELKYLFKGTHKWTRETGVDFLTKSWKYIDY